MARRKQPETPANLAPPVARGVDFPRRATARPSAAAAPVRIVRQPEGFGAPRERTFDAATIETMANLPGFQAWVGREKEIDDSIAMTMAEWAPIMHEYATRPIGGHRRAQRTRR